MGECGTMLNPQGRVGGTQGGGLQRAHLCGGHVDERISDIAAVLEVDGQVEKVIFAVESCGVYGLHQNLLGVLVRNVPDHQRGAGVLARASPDCFGGEDEMLPGMRGAPRAPPARVQILSN